MLHVDVNEHLTPHCKASHLSLSNISSPNNVSIMLIEVIVSLKESETVLCLVKKLQTVAHTTIFNHSEAPSDISTAAAKGPAALPGRWCIPWLSWFHLPWLSAWGSQSLLQFFTHGIWMKHWLLSCIEDLLWPLDQSLRIAPSHVTTVSHYKCPTCLSGKWWHQMQVRFSFLFLTVPPDISGGFKSLA